MREVRNDKKSAKKVRRTLILLLNIEKRVIIKKPQKNVLKLIHLFLFHICQIIAIPPSPPSPPNEYLDKLLGSNDELTMNLLIL